MRDGQQRDAGHAIPCRSRLRVERFHGSRSSGRRSHHANLSGCADVQRRARQRYYLLLSAGVGMAEAWSEYVTANGQYTAPNPADSLGSSDADITGAYINFNLTARTGPWPGGADISSVALAVYYTVPGGGPPSNQTQVLELSGGGPSLPADAVIAGVEVNFETGLAFGSGGGQTAQLTVGRDSCRHVRSHLPRERGLRLPHLAEMAISGVRRACLGRRPTSLA